VDRRAAVAAIMQQLGADKLDTLFLAVPVEAVPLIGGLSPLPALRFTINPGLYCS
jgi:hypothetical protein